MVKSTIRSIAEDLGRFPAAIWKLVSSVTSFPGSDGLFWPLGALAMHTVHIHT